MNRILKMIQGTKPEYRKLNLLDIPGKLRNQYTSPIFLTPRYQKILFT